MSDGLDEFYGRLFEGKNVEIIKLRAEVERLRAEIEHGDAQAKIMLDSYADENQRFHDEIERLLHENSLDQKLIHDMAEQRSDYLDEIERLSQQRDALLAAAKDAVRWNATTRVSMHPVWDKLSAAIKLVEGK